MHTEAARANKMGERSDLAMLEFGVAEELMTWMWVVWVVKVEAVAHRVEKVVAAESILQWHRSQNTQVMSSTHI